MNGAEAVSNDETDSASGSFGLERLLDSLESYRWIAKLVLVVLGMLALSVVLDVVVGAPIIGGLLATGALLLAVCVFLVIAAGIVYRTVTATFE